MKGWFFMEDIFCNFTTKTNQIYVTHKKKVKNNETSYLLHLKFGGTSTYKTQTAIPTFIY